MVDRSARKDLLTPQQRDAYVAGALPQVTHLINSGLSRNCRFLDLGCGRMRYGVYLIPYLSVGRYTGADISREALDAGRSILRQKGIEDSRYDVLWLEGGDYMELSDLKFEVVWASSVLTHMELSDIKVLLSSLRKHIAPGGRFLFTFSEAPKLERSDLKDFFHPIAVIAGLCEEAGYDFELDEGYSGWESYDRLGVATPRSIS